MNKSQRLKQKRLQRRNKRKQRTRQALLAPAQQREAWEKAVTKGFTKLGWAKPEVTSHMKVIRRSGTMVQDLAYSMSPDEYIKRITERVDLNDDEGSDDSEE